LEASATKAAQLEQDNRKLAARTAAAVKAEEKAFETAAELKKKLASLQREFATAMKEKDESHEVEKLSLAQKHNAQLQQALNAKLLLDGKHDVKSDLHHPHHDAAAVAATGSEKPLLRAMDSLNKQLEEQRAHYEQMQAKAQEAHRSDLERLQNRYQDELASSRALIQELDDKVDSQKAKVSEAERDVQVASRKQKTAEMQAEKWKGEVGVLRQSLQAVKSMSSVNAGDMLPQEEEGRGGHVSRSAAAKASSSSSSGKDAAYRDENAQIQVIKATAEAEKRRLANKVEYLKAQLESENTCKEELRRSVTSLTEALRDSKQAKKQAIVDAETAKRKEMRRLEEKLQAELEGPRHQVSQLQAKVAMLQGSMTELIQDCELAKRKEEQARLEALRFEAEHAALAAQREEMQDRLEELQETVSAAATSVDDAKQATLEATLRRMENEQKYLKSQLTSEMKCKEALEASLQQVTEQFQKSSAKWSSDKQELESRTRVMESHTEQEVSKWKEDHHLFTAEVQQLKQQLESTREDYARSKAKLRATENDLEQARRTLSRMQQDFLSTKEDLKNEKMLSRTQKERYEQSVAALESSMDHIRASTHQEVDTVSNELEQKLSEVSETQKEMLRLREEMSLRDVRHNATRGYERLCLALHHWSLGQKRKALRTWTCAAGAVAKAEAIARIQVSAANEGRQHWQEEKDRVCALLLEQYRKDKKTAVESMAKQFAVQLREQQCMSVEVNRNPF
jgi:chromosome segregation ATPase